MIKTALTLKQLMEEGTYIIPIYQRNYAWGKAEISQLIKDIHESFEIENENSMKNYYIGSLVCFKRQDGSFELIDGQQRHTTISLINLVLKNSDALLDSNLKIENSVSHSNIKFDSRRNSQKFIEELYECSDFKTKFEAIDISGTENFKSAISIIREELLRMGKHVERFSKSFYNNVKFFRVEVPEDTDVNHYFEIMNNRGEQLEKHEIVKANLMSRIEEKNRESFALIWDACSDMSDYIYFNFDKKYREKLFNQGNLDVNLDNFDKLKLNSPECISSESSKDELLYILNNITKHELDINFSQEEKITKEKYKSIIDFPNFLLQVLKLSGIEVPLDDKKLLECFEVKKNKINPEKFIFELLKYRTLFDKYIIKQNLLDEDENKRNWGIRCLYDLKEDEVEDSFKEDHSELRMMQTMLYYSNPSNSSNNWLFETLSFINESIGLDEITAEFNKISSSRYDKDKMSYPRITVVNLYYIDFLLWKFYKEYVQSGNSTKEPEDDLKELKVKIFAKSGLFNSFRFRQLNSKEHLLPQSKIDTVEIKNNVDKLEIINCLGNLCLISTSQNSSGNKEHPEYKKRTFGNDNLSLKRLVMFESFENDIWNTTQIKEHEKEIAKLIIKYSN